MALTISESDSSTTLPAVSTPAHLLPLDSTNISPQISSQKNHLGLGAVPDSLSIAASPNPLFFMLEEYCAKEKAALQEAPLLEKQISNVHRQHAALSQEEAELAAKHAQKTNTLKSWKVATDITSYGASAASIVVGVGFCASPIGSVALVASGAFGLASKLMGDTGGWKWVASKFSSDEKTQQKYASYLETTATVVSLGVSAISGFMFSGALNFTPNFQPTVITSTVAAISTATSVVNNYTQASVLTTEAGLKAIDQKKTALFNPLTFFSDHLKFTSDVNSAILKILKAMLRNNFYTFN